MAPLLLESHALQTRVCHTCGLMALVAMTAVRGIKSAMIRFAPCCVWINTLRVAASSGVSIALSLMALKACLSKQSHCPFNLYPPTPTPFPLLPSHSLSPLILRHWLQAPLSFMASLTQRFIVRHRYWSGIYCACRDLHVLSAQHGVGGSRGINKDNRVLGCA